MYVPTVPLKFKCFIRVACCCLRIFSPFRHTYFMRLPHLPSYTLPIHYLSIYCCNTLREIPKLVFLAGISPALAEYRYIFRIVKGLEFSREEIARFPLFPYPRILIQVDIAHN